MSKQLPVTPYQTSGFQFEYREVPRKTHKEVISRTTYDEYDGHIMHEYEEIDVPDELENGYQDQAFDYDAVEHF